MREAEVGGASGGEGRVRTQSGRRGIARGKGSQELLELGVEKGFWTRP